MVKIRLTKKEKSTLNLSEKLILFYRRYPVIAVKELFNIDLIWFQRIILRSLFKHKYILLLLGRGIGKTWMGSLFCVLYALLYPGVAIGIITPSFKQTEFFFDKIDELYESSPYMRAACVKKPFRATFKAALKFKNGSFIEGLPLGTGQKIRGRRYHIIWVDEYAVVDEIIIKTVVRPMMNIKRAGFENKYIMSSTAYYTWNHFYTQYVLYHYMMKRKPDLYAVHEYIDEDVLIVKDPPFELDKEIYEMMRMDTTEELYLMENKGVFPLENVGFFSAQLLDRCTPRNNETQTDSPIEVYGEEGSIYTIGIDAARVAGGDNFSLSVIKIDGNKKRFVNNLTLNGASYQKMIRLIRETLKRYKKIVQINIDAGGGGMTLKDLLAEKYQDREGHIYPPIYDMEEKEIPVGAIPILKLIKFTAPVVNDLYMRLKADFQQTNLLLPIDLRRSSDKELEKSGQEIIQTKRELLVLQAEKKGNHYHFDVPAQFKKDRATSLALANQAANEFVTGETKTFSSNLGIGFWV